MKKCLYPVPDHARKHQIPFNSKNPLQEKKRKEQNKKSKKLAIVSLQSPNLDEEAQAALGEFSLHVALETLP